MPNIKMKHIPKIIAATGVAFTVPSPGNVTGYPVFSGSVGTGFVCPCVVAVPCGSSSVPLGALGEICGLVVGCAEYGGAVVVTTVDAGSPVAGARIVPQLRHSCASVAVAGGPGIC